MSDQKTEPEWMQVLRRDVAASSQRAIARKLGVVASVINEVLSRKYRHTPKKLQAAVERELMRSTVACPAVGTMKTSACRAWQTRTHPTMDPMAKRIMRTCPGCKNNLRNWR